MTPTQIFGPHLRDMMEYVGWLKETTDKTLESLHTDWEACDDAIRDAYDKLTKAHTFLSQPMQESWFVRPAKPKCSHCENHNCGNNELGCGLIEDYEAWQHWQPLFLGEWEVDNG